MKIVAFMPIRLNSTRVAAKSVRDLGGRPLFCWQLQVLDSLNIPVHVYCSEPAELMRLVDFTARNVIFTRRPARLDGHDVKGIDIYREFARAVPADVYLLTHCTSPFIRADTFRECMEAVAGGEHDSALTVEPIQTFCWHAGRAVNFPTPRPPTQTLEPVYRETSAAYCFTSEVLMRGERSSASPRLVKTVWPETEDIDHEEDFARCELVAPLVVRPEMPVMPTMRPRVAAI